MSFKDSFIDKASGTLTNSHRRARKQEKAIAKQGKGYLTPGSGNKYQKGDVKKYNKYFRIEAKTTKNKSFSITREMIDKIEDASLTNNEFPVIIVEFINGAGKPEHEIALVPVYVLNSWSEEE